MNVLNKNFKYQKCKRKTKIEQGEKVYNHWIVYSYVTLNVAKKNTYLQLPRVTQPCTRSKDYTP